MIAVIHVKRQQNATNVYGTVGTTLKSAVGRHESLVGWVLRPRLGVSVLRHPKHLERIAGADPLVARAEGHVLQGVGKEAGEFVPARGATRLVRRPTGSGAPEHNFRWYVGKGRAILGDHLCGQDVVHDAAVRRRRPHCSARARGKGRWGRSRGKTSRMRAMKGEGGRALAVERRRSRSPSPLINHGSIGTVGKHIAPLLLPPPSSFIRYGDRYRPQQNAHDAAYSLRFSSSTTPLSSPSCIGRRGEPKGKQREA